MKKNMIALLLSVVMASGSIGSVPALAAETTAQKTVAVEEEASEQAENVTAETEVSDTDEAEEGTSEVEPVEDSEQDSTAEAAEETETDENTEEVDSADTVDTSAEIADEEEPETVTEEEVAEVEGKEAMLAEAGDVVDSGTCGGDAVWTLTGEGSNLTLTISGKGKMSSFTKNNLPWESEKTNIKTVVVENGITSIGYVAFYNCSNITSINLPDSVNYIASDAFSGCSSLTSINLPNGLASIFEAVFYNCSSLTSIEIPDSIKRIGDEAFSGCSNLTSITIPDSVTSIGYSVFKDCSNLTSITIPDGVTSIGHAAFSGCSNLTSIDIPDSVTSIDDYTFYGCSSLTSITIPGTVTSIGKYAFKDCNSLTSITIPDSVTSIRYEAFSGCCNVTSITIPDSVTSIDGYAFEDCSSLKSIIIPNRVTSIGSGTFSGCIGLTSITIPGIVTSIGEYAFKDCSSLKSITIPNRVTSIGSGTFSGCIGLTSITIPDGVTSIEDWTFSGCSGLKSITIPDSVTNIGGYAFSNCKGLTSITIPDSVTNIGSRAFYGCKSLILSIANNSYAVQYAKDNYLNYVLVANHVYGDWTVIKEATCTEEGIRERICTDCGEKATETIPTKSHSWNKMYTVDKEPTCTEQGSESIHCSVCDVVDETTIRAVPKAEHAYGDWTVTKGATCTEDGSKERVCENCGDKITEAIRADHTWNKEYTIDKEATCTEEGSESIHCSDCGTVNETTVRTIPKKDHAYGDWIVTKEATCTEDGIKEKTCADCGDKATETIPANGHSWNEEYIVDKEPTCTEEGSESIHCSDCGTIDETTVRTIPKKAHIYGDWTVTKEATCTEDGIKEKICADCGNKITETIPANGHSWNEEYTVDKEATCTEEGSESIHCSACGTIDETTVSTIPKRDHTYGDWTVTQEPTCTEDGIKEKVCADCGDKITEAIPAKGHIWNEEYTIDKEATRTEVGSESIHCSKCDTSDESTVRAIPMISGYQIEYVLGGGENSSENPDLYYLGDEYTLKAPARVGYTFEGWFSDESLTDNITGITRTQAGDLVLYAKWKPNTYNVTFNGNTANSGKMSQISYTVGSTVLPANAYTKKEYVFAGWNTKEDGTGTDIKNQGSLDSLDTENGSIVTLYAQWKVKEYKIVYTLNGGTNNKSNPATYNYFKAVTSLANPTRKGYAFKGWFTDAKYKTAFAGIRKGSTGNKIVYAKWSAVKYSIQYVLNGGKAPTGNPASYYITTATTRLKNPTRKGYTFAGWFKESTFKTKVTSITKGSAGNLKLYAKWVPTKYTITYKLNGGTNNKSNPANYTSTTAKITLQKPTRKGYTFEGWFSDSGYKNKSAVVNKGSTGNKTFYAKWKINKYSISYVLNGGKAPSGNPAAYYVTTADIKLKNPTRTGYTFAGWYKETTFKTKVTSIPKGSAGNLKLYAKWTATKYKITYNLNGGTNNKSNPATYTIATASITLQKPTRKGCVFEGWYSDSKFKNKVTAISKGSTGNKTLYARWKIYEYLISYELNGGRFAVGNPASYNVNTPTITLLNAKRTGYVFAGWYKEASFKTRVTKIPKGSYGNLKLYAKWETPEENKIRRVYESILKDGEKAGDGKCIGEYNEYSSGYAFNQTSIIANGDLIFTYYYENNMGWTTAGMISYSFKDRKWSPFVIENNDNYADFTAYAVIDPKTYCINDNKGIKGYTLKEVDYKTSNTSVANSVIKLDVGEGIRNSFFYWDSLLQEELGISFADLGYSRFYASKYD